MFNTTEILELWERKNEFMGMVDIKGVIYPNYYRTLFFKFFNVSDYSEDKPEDTKAGYQFLLDKIEDHKFKRSENVIACLIYTYNLSKMKWEGNKRNLYIGFNFSEICPIFLESLFHLLPIKSPIPKHFFDNCSLISDSINNELDNILFESKNLMKLIDLFKNNSIYFPDFIEFLKLRDGCVLPRVQSKIAYIAINNFVASESKYHGQGYEQSLNTFFNIIERELKIG